MTRDEWRQIKQIASGALEQPPSARAAYVAKHCGSDAALLQEVKSLVACATDAEDLFETPKMLMAGAAEALDSLRPFEPPRAGERIGAYQIVKELGGGGMGAAYLAVRADAEFEKRVAIKLIRRGLDSDAVLRRFRHERQIVADLEHPNIARLLDGGTTGQGLPYFVMEYVDGTPIDAHCRARQLSIRDRVVLFQRVCDAVQYAHGQQVIHRDLKPSNILVTADGVPKLLDFGISKLLTTDAPGERSESTWLPHAMTPPYASPEQVRGEPITPATDIYSLGVLLYELLTGTRPYRLEGRTLRDIDDVICREEPEPPSASADKSVRTSLKGDLDRIVLMALRKEPERRYPTVAALADDLSRYLQGLPVHARSGDVGYRAAKFVRRHRLRLIEAAVIVAVLGAAAMVASRTQSDRAATALRAVDAVGVMPLAIAASDRDIQYLSHGLTEGLIDGLSESPRLRVPSMNAVAAVEGPPSDPQALAKALNVDAVMRGTISQKGEAVAMAVELVDGSSGRRLWRSNYDGSLSALEALRERVTRDLLDTLGLEADRARGLSTRQTQNPEAYELYLKGRYVWNARTEDGFRRSLEYFTQAVGKDTQYARAYAGLADSYNLLGVWGALSPAEAMPRAKDAARRALAIDGTLAEAHTSLAFAHWVYDWDWDAAAAEFQRALALDPEYATAHQWYAYYQASRGNFDNAIASIERAHQIEPVSLSISTDVAEIRYWARRYDAAVGDLQTVLQLEPNFAMARNILGLTYLAMGRADDALVQLEAANRLASGPRMLSTLAHAYGAAGQRDRADEAVASLRRRATERYTSSFAMAVAALGTGRTDEALDYLERAFAERSDSMVILRVYPLLDPLRDHPRFRALVNRVGIPRAEE